MEYIHHYTTLQNLALILNSGKLRFTRFDLLDDKDEVSVIPDKLAAARTWCYISSWTDNPKESVPLWKMYSSIYDGVRISMPVDMFNKNIIQAFDAGYHGLTQTRYNVPLTKEEIFYSGNYWIVNFFDKEHNDFYKKVEFRDDVKELYDSFINYNEEKGTLHITNMWDWGKYKYPHWQFLDEVRFVLITQPLPPLTHSAINGDFNKQYEFITVANGQPNSVKYIDVSLSNIAIEKMKITLAPCISEANRILLKALVRDNGIDEGCISDSEFSGKLIK